MNRLGSYADQDLRIKGSYPGSALFVMPNRTHFPGEPVQ
jgi:hypothetical protein